MSVAAISLPQNMAYALIVGVDPIYGIYSTIISMIVFTFVGKSNYMIVGPTNIMAMALASSISGFAQGEYLGALLLLTFMVGICQLLFGLFKLGSLVNYISDSLILGLSTGAVLMIAVGQLQNFMGLTVAGGSNFYTKVYAVVKNMGQVNWTSLLIGIITVFLIIIIKRFNPRWPAYLIGLSIITVIVYIFKLETSTAVVGDLPSGILKFNMLSFKWSSINTLLSKALSIAFLGLIQTLAVVKSLTVYTKEEVDINSEFIGQGIINMVGSFFNAFATAGSFAKSFANIQAGASTKFSQFFAGILIIISLLFIKPLITYVPIAGLASLVIIVAVNSVKIKEISKNLKIIRGDAIIFIVTFLATISLPSIDSAIYIGILASVMVVLKKTEDISLEVIRYEDKEDKFVQRKVGDLNEKNKNEKFLILNLRGNLHFSSVNNLKEKFEIVFKYGDNFLIRLREIERMDITIMRELSNFIDKIQESGGQVILSGVDAEQYDRMKRYGIISKVKKENVYQSEDILFSSTKDAYYFMEIN